MTAQQALLPSAAALAGYAILMAANPARRVLRDGRRCVSRFPILWGAPLFFFAAYALFGLALELISTRYLADTGGAPPVWWSGWSPREIRELLGGAVLPSLERLAGLFTNSIPTFPVSGLLAALLLMRPGRARDLLRGLRHCYGRWSRLLLTGILLAAVAAALKPLLYPVLPIVGQGASAARWFALAAVIDWGSFLFEWLVGVTVQVWLIVVVRGWIRGQSPGEEALRRLTLHRVGYVFFWTGIVMALNSLLIHLPLLAPHFIPGTPGLDRALPFVETVARGFLCAVAILFCSMQVNLVFHNETLAEAWRDHLALAHRAPGVVLWFLAVAMLHFFLLSLLDALLTSGFGESSAPAYAWRLVRTFPAAWLTGWLLASWVCLVDAHGRSGRGPIPF